MKKGWGILGTLLFATSSVTGCGAACSAVGYVSIITVTLEGHAAAVDEVQLCSDQGCSQRSADETAGSVQTVAPGSSADPSPSHVMQPAFLSSRKDATTWQFTVAQSGNPHRVTVRALGADHTVLAQQQNDLVWTSAEGYAPCPGPVTTPSITLKVP
ncbi:hypothetical protein [Pseudarthrobacter sp. C4D7]|uniref:hypothetical protein n=1 Tax=Pseudarthrobacter sp. C4D7 TaxID=2735268 RepID=UPI001584B526|nr:hypothetical protein [Pseudarthrobacter sp. C4D7]NUT70997.1 hypothetical protein [Pseudarthrobacter sp. C4D7]